MNEADIRVAQHIVNAERERAAKAIEEVLHNAGWEVSCMNFTGDNSFPQEYYIKKGDMEGLGPTFEMALIDLLLKLLKNF
jgi:hypothetical protein